jgi:hypothetical protein
MEEKGYFVKDEAHALGAETVSEPNNDEAVVYEDFCRWFAYASASDAG